VCGIPHTLWVCGKRSTLVLKKTQSSKIELWICGLTPVSGVSSRVSQGSTHDSESPSSSSPTYFFTLSVSDSNYYELTHELQAFFFGFCFVSTPLALITAEKISFYLSFFIRWRCSNRLGTLASYGTLDFAFDAKEKPFEIQLCPLVFGRICYCYCAKIQYCSKWTWNFKKSF